MRVCTTAVAATRRFVHHSPRARVPLIKFLGKRSLLPRGSVASPATSAVASAPPAAKTYTTSSTAVDFYTLPDTAWFGRPRISQAELDEGNDSGGATYI